jgi:hypothetical protein
LHLLAEDVVSVGDQAAVGVGLADQVAAQVIGLAVDEAALVADRQLAAQPVVADRAGGAAGAEVAAVAGWDSRIRPYRAVGEKFKGHRCAGEFSKGRIGVSAVAYYR